MPRLIGLTGGIASGKSSVAQLLAARGAAVVDSDLLAREVVEPGRPALGEIVAEFGPGILDAAGRLDRAAMGELVFADAAARRRLEAIVHPRVEALSGERAVAALASAAPLVVLDIPLLFERGRESAVEGVLLVWCDQATQLRRLVERSGLSAGEAGARIAAQMPLDEKRELATWVIENTGSIEELEGLVAGWWDEVVSGPAGRRTGVR